MGSAPTDLSTFARNRTLPQEAPDVSIYDKGPGRPKDAPARARVCLLLLYRLYGQASLVILDPRAELKRLRMLKEYELGGDVLQGDQFAPLA